MRLILNIKSNTLVSVVIPTYNHAKFLNKALNSLIKQTYDNWEAIVVDNNSIDNTTNIVKKFNDKRIRYFKFSNNGIIAKSRNFGIKKSRGKWIAFLDSDDWWRKNKLYTCLKNIDRNVDFVYHDLQIKYFNSKKYLNKTKIGRQLKKPILEDMLIGEIKKGNAIGNSSVVVRKSILRKIGGISENKKLVASEDFNTWLKIAKITEHFKYIDKTLGYYLVHDKSSQKRDLSIPHREAVKEFTSFFNSKQKLNLEIKLRYMSGSYNFLNNNYEKAKNDLLFVIKNGEINLRFKSLIKVIFLFFKK